MYARLRQKLSIANGTQTATTTSLGSNAFSLLTKDIGRLITGQITTAGQLNSEIWDIPNSEVVSTVAAGWSEYQSTFLSSNVDITTGGLGINFTANNCVVFLRSPSAMTTSTGGTIYKYGGLGSVNQASGQYGAMLNTLIPWSVTSWTGNPVLTYFVNSATSTGTGLARNSLQLLNLQEIILYASPRCFVFSARNITQGGTAPQKVYMQLEYPATTLSQIYNLPNQVIYEHSNGINSTITGLGSVFDNSAYNVVGGYKNADGGNDIFANANNKNLAVVYTPYLNAPTGGWNSLWSTGGASLDASTFKPATYGSMSNTVDSSGNTITVPAMPLIHYPSWDSEIGRAHV